MDEASRLFNEMIDSNLVPNEATYNVMIEGYFLVGNIRKVFQLYDQMIDRGLTPDNDTYRPLISGLWLTSHALKAKEFVANLENECSLNKFSLTTLMHGFCREGRLTEAYHVWSEMAMQGINLDLVSSTIIVYTTLKLHDTEKSCVLLREMTEKSVRLENVFHTCMIDVHSKEGNMVQALNSWDNMIVDGCFPNTGTCTVLVNNLCKSGHLSSVELLCKEMLSSHFLPNNYTYNCFLDYFTTEGKLDKAKDISISPCFEALLLT
ncbi:hypothetical protein CFC21_044137 [Triticum aestivum]|uniref:Pentacotripeptide-repeat region of PRORP domain-containing protein n=1 Tax=Triticum aestivum TaxID=4565 RepID=A0A9R1JX94_WHEAT|nr:hypothetical protein CFC21_044137 [Triticum aestivum]